MAKVTFRLDGVDELLRKLAKLEKGSEVRKVIRQSLRQAAKPLLSTARQIAPEGESGRLRRGLKIRSARRSRRGIGVVVRPGTRSELGIPATAKGYYPAHIEVGTKSVEETRFLRDAAELEQNEIFEILADGIGSGLERIARTA